MSQQICLFQTPLSFLLYSISTSLPLFSLKDFDYAAGALQLKYVIGKWKIQGRKEAMRSWRDKVRLEQGIFQSVHPPIIAVPQRLFWGLGDMPAIHFIPFISGHKAEESAHGLPESVLKHQRGAQHHSRNKYKILCHPIRGKKTLAFFPCTSGKCFTHCFDVSHPFCWTDQQQILINLTSIWEHAHSEFRLPLLIKLHPCTLCLAAWNRPLQKQSSIICKLFKHNI